MIHEAMSSDSSELEGPPTFESLHMAPSPGGPIEKQKYSMLSPIFYGPRYLFSWIATSSQEPTLFNHTNALSLVPVPYRRTNSTQRAKP